LAKQPDERISGVRAEPCVAAVASGPRRWQTTVSGRRKVAEEGEASCRMKGRDEEEAAEQAREHAHGQEEAGPAGDPIAIRSATGRRRAR